jgi:CRISPR type III-A-associated RAMP protein Csm3
MAQRRRPGSPLDKAALDAARGPVRDEVKRILQLFGVGGGELKDAAALAAELGPTRLAFWDCSLSPAWEQAVRDNNQMLTEVKSENRINRISGVAEHPRNTERVPAGACFDFRLSLRRLAGDDERLLDTVLQGLKLIEFDSLGGSGSRGYGKVRFTGLCIDGQDSRPTSTPSRPSPPGPRAMNTYRLTLQPLSAFGTPLAGDTLFGQLCWALRHRSATQPSPSSSTATPPGGPSRSSPTASRRPPATARAALPAGGPPATSTARPSSGGAGCPSPPAEPLPGWQALARDDAAAAHAIGGRPAPRSRPSAPSPTTPSTARPAAPAPAPSPLQPAPAVVRQRRALRPVRVLDETRLPLAELLAALTQIGHTGFGRDASTGLGKFALVGEPWPTPSPPAAPARPGSASALRPQGQGYCPRRSYYQPSPASAATATSPVHAASPFKRPLLLARAGGLFVPLRPAGRPFIGQGLGGSAAPCRRPCPKPSTRATPRCSASTSRRPADALPHHRPARPHPRAHPHRQR